MTWLQPASSSDIKTYSSTVNATSLITVYNACQVLETRKNVFTCIRFDHTVFHLYALGHQ
jgi:hypothetical protein